MINTVIIDNESATKERLRNYLKQFESNIQINGFYSSILEAFEAQSEAELIFCDTSILQEKESAMIPYTQYKQVICLGNHEKDAYTAYRVNALDFILKPIDDSQMIKAVERIRNSFGRTQTKKSNCLGIPTLNGYDFIKFHDIIKCEGLQSYTRIVLRDKPDIISSYNIGQVKKLLIPKGFFSPHKSYLINLDEIEKYSKEGVIYLRGGLHVPLARRRKKAFFDKIALVK